MVSSNALTAQNWYELGHERKRSGDHTGALDAFRRSIKLNPHVAAPWVGLAQLLDSNNQLQQARQCLQKSVVAEPSNALARRLLASSHKALGYVDEAKSEFQQALKLDPTSSPTHCGLGQLFEDLGQPEQAAKAYRKALALDSSQQDALSYLLGLSRHIDVSAEIDQAQNLLDQLALQDKALIGYGLGKAHEQQKNYAAAFDAYSVANLARRRTSPEFCHQAFDARIDTMIELFSADFFKARKGWGNTSQSPVFIVGLPRSGTTLTEQIIGSHPDCFGAGELNTLTDLATGTPDRLSDIESCWPSCAPNLSRQQLTALGLDYLEQSSIRAPDNTLRVVDKQPLNFWHLGLIAIALPNARIIHCQRDIRDCGFSIYSHNFNAEQNWSTNLEDIAHYWRGYQKLMQHFAAVSGLRILDVAYENTVSDLTGSAERLLNFLDLPWDNGVLNFHENERAVQTPSRWQVRQPVYKSSVERWQRYGDRLDPLIKAVE